MKSKHGYSPHPATWFFLLTVALALFSWIGSIYGLGTVQSLLSPEGIRWELRHVTGNLVDTPVLGRVIILFLGIGIVSRAGMADALWRLCRRGKLLSRKEKRAVLLSIVVLAVYVLLVFMTTFAPWALLRSVTGSLANSPFEKGCCYLFSFGVGLAGIVFGLVSGRFRTDRDIVAGMASLFAGFADYFVILFFVVQFFSSLAYTRLAEWIGIPSSVVQVAFQACCYLPLAVILLQKKKCK